MACFAGDINLRPGGVISFFVVGIVFSQVGGVAFGTHVIPVLSNPGPVQYIPGRNGFILVNMEPALPSICCQTRIPAQRKALVPATWEFNEVLLQRPYSKHIGNLIIDHISLWTFCIHHVLSILHKKPGGNPVMGDGRFIEITQHSFRIGLIHGHVVVRSLEEVELFLMALFAALPSNVLCCEFIDLRSIGLTGI